MTAKMRLTAYRWALWRLEDIAYNLKVEDPKHADALRLARDFAHDGMLFVRDARPDGEEIVMNDDRFPSEVEFLMRLQDVSDRLADAGIQAFSPVEYERKVRL